LLDCRRSLLRFLYVRLLGFMAGELAFVLQIFYHHGHCGAV
jgi:hypothetical protein